MTKVIFISYLVLILSCLYECCKDHTVEYDAILERYFENEET